MQTTSIIGLYPGSFDPFTRGHLDMVRRGLGLCDRLVIGVGENMDKQYHFTPSERAALIRHALGPEFPAALLARISVEIFAGAMVLFAERAGAGLVIKGVRNAADYAHEERMALVNHRLAPQIETVLLLADNALRDVSSSAVKELARAGIAAHHFDPYLTPEIRDALLARSLEKARP